MKNLVIGVFLGFGILLLFMNSNKNNTPAKAVEQNAFFAVHDTVFENNAAASAHDTVYPAVAASAHDTVYLAAAASAHDTVYLAAAASAHDTATVGDTIAPFKAKPMSSLTLTFPKNAKAPTASSSLWSISTGFGSSIDGMGVAQLRLMATPVAYMSPQLQARVLLLQNGASSFNLVPQRITTPIKLGSRFTLLPGMSDMSADSMRWVASSGWLAGHPSNGRKSARETSLSNIWLKPLESKIDTNLKKFASAVTQVAVVGKFGHVWFELAGGPWLQYDKYGKQTGEASLAFRIGGGYYSPKLRFVCSFQRRTNEIWAGLVDVKVNKFQLGLAAENEKDPKLSIPANRLRFGASMPGKVWSPYAFYSAAGYGAKISIASAGLGLQLDSGGGLKYFGEMSLINSNKAEGPSFGGWQQPTANTTNLFQLGLRKLFKS